jgi:glycosyltransferase involved in cell wall biosynthesis
MKNKYSAAQIGIVIPAYNAAAFLAETLDSVLSQTFGDWICLVVDDESTDGTRMLAERFAIKDQRIQVHTVLHGGQAAARNAGEKLLPPDIPFIIFLDADDVWEVTALATLRETLMTHPDAVAAAALLREIDESSRLLIVDDDAALRSVVSGYHRRGVVGWRLIHWPHTAPTTLATLAVELHIKTPGQVLIRREALRRAGPFIGAMSPSEDWDMLLRLALEGPILHVPEILLRKRKVRGSQSMQPALMRRAEPYLRRAWSTRPGLSHVQRHTMRLGHLYGAARRFAWSREAVRGRQWAEAAGQAVRGVKAIVRCALIEGRGMLSSPQNAAHVASTPTRNVQPLSTITSSRVQSNDRPSSEVG